MIFRVNFHSRTLDSPWDEKSKVIRCFAGARILYFLCLVRDDGYWRQRLHMSPSTWMQLSKQSRTHAIRRFRRRMLPFSMGCA